MNGPNTSSDWKSTAKINAGKCWAKMENKMVRLRERDSEREGERNRIVGQSPKDGEWDGEREKYVGRRWRMGWGERKRGVWQRWKMAM